MRRSRRWRLSRSLLALVLLAVVACGNENKRLGADSDGSTASYVSRFGVDTSKCQDELVDGHLGTIVPIGTTMPLSGGPAKAFAPLAAGLEAYVAYANERGLLGDHTLQLTVEDDQLNPQLTRPAVLKLIEFNRVALLTGMVGTESNLAMRELLNKECYPQLFANSASPALGDVERSPWTSGGVAPANTETAMYVHDMQARFPHGATVALFGVNRELGSSYASALERLAAGAKLQVVDEQTIDSGESGPPTAQVTSIAAKRPDVILAAPLGDQCPTFLTAIGRARAADASWQPRIYLTSSCASAALLGRAGGDADGVITATALKDVNDPALANDAAVKDLRGALVGTGFPPDGDFATAAVGWTQMEATVEVLINAAASSGGLTRASIINAARDLTFTPSLARAGVSFVTIGAADPFVLESLQLVRFDATRGGYSEVGPLVTEFEGKSERSP